MNDALLEAFRHNAWATRHLLSFCQDLSEEQLTTPSVGTYAGIRDTFNHVIRADAKYLRRLAGSGPDWIDDREPADLEQLEKWAEEAESQWEQYLSGPIDSERVLTADNGANEVHASIFIAQALYHGTAHREQICSILTSFGIEPPDIQAWGYAWATGRIWERAAGEPA